MNKLLFTFCFLVLFSVNSYGQLFKNFNVFSVDDDIKLGKQLRDEIAKDPQTYPVLSERDYPEAYRYLKAMRDQILNTGVIQYREQFAWELFIIRDDSTLNAFVTPGGYIYVYTGLIKYLDNEDQLAGVMGHEIAHADRRHSTRNLTKQYGFSTVLSLLLGGNPSELSQILGAVTGQLGALKFSRTSESEADAYSVEYLARTKYQCDGAAGFFQKILDQGNSQAPPQFLSTHPSSANRVRDIQAKAQSLGCDTSLGGSNYEAFKRSLP